MNRFESVHNLAKRKAKQLNLTPPINVEKIINSLGINIIEERNQYGIEAYSELGDNPTIIINPEMTFYEPRKNFTLAHELGHILIPWHNGDIKCNFEDNYIKVNGKRLLDTQELEANIFASDFLMPQEWLRELIDDNVGISFDKLVNLVANKANTSIMACFYALEQVLPSGYSYFVKKDSSEWWNFFASHNTYTVNWFSYNEEKIVFFESLAIQKEEFKIGPYDIILYKMIPCPSKRELIDELHKNNGSVDKLINNITKGYKLRILPFLDVVLDSITENRYIAYLFDEDKLVETFYSEQSPLRRIYGSLGYEAIREILTTYGFEFQSIYFENGMVLLYISEKKFDMPEYEDIDPNLLLRQLCDIHGYDTYMLQSINGVMSAANSQYGDKYTNEELYNWCKYRFISNTKYRSIVGDENFDRYIVNKIKSMKNKRKH